MVEKINKIWKDPLGIFFAKYDSARMVILRKYSNTRMYITMTFRGVKHGKNIDFYGRTHFRRAYLSKIVIGNGCRFRSAFISNNVGLNRPCLISTLREGAQVIIGKNVGMSGTVIGCAQSIVIGDNVLLGGNTFITDFDWHSISDRNKPAESKPVIIEDDVFIGTGVMILKGTTIGKGAVIGANSVVTGHIPNNVIAAGNPCMIIRHLV